MSITIAKQFIAIILEKLELLHEIECFRMFDHMRITIW